MSAQPDALPGVAAAAGSAAGLTTRELDRRATSSLVWQGAKVAVHLIQYVVLARLVLPPSSASSHSSRRSFWSSHASTMAV
jgi:hypothetical protein